jgi:serine/threonine protein kinase
MPPTPTHILTPPPPPPPHAPGTLDYMAPEVLKCPLKTYPDENKQDSSLHYSSSVDTWAVGVLAYELLTGGWGHVDHWPAGLLPSCPKRPGAGLLCC